MEKVKIGRSPRPLPIFMRICYGFWVTKTWKLQRAFVGSFAPQTEKKNSKILPQIFANCAISRSWAHQKSSWKTVGSPEQWYNGTQNLKNTIPIRNEGVWVVQHQRGSLPTLPCNDWISRFTRVYYSQLARIVASFVMITFERCCRNLYKILHFHVYKQFLRYMFLRDP